MHSGGQRRRRTVTLARFRAEPPAVNLPSPAASTESASAQERRVAFESLRERTDELELIISGISLLALLALPGWLFDHWVRLELHAEGQRVQREIAGYAQLSQAAMKSTRMIADNVSQWKRTAENLRNG